MVSVDIYLEQSQYGHPVIEMMNTDCNQTTTVYHDFDHSNSFSHHFNSTGCPYDALHAGVRLFWLYKTVEIYV